MTSYKVMTDFANVPVMWKPQEDNQRIIEFWKHISKKYNVKIDNYWDLHRWTIENIPEFWGELWDCAKVIHSKTYEKVIDRDVKMTASYPEWFKGARLNYAENILRYRDDHTALIADGEDKETKKFTYAELYREACRYGAALKALGLKEGDTVVCYMSNRVEAVFAMLGATAAGAVWGGTLPLIGAKAVLSRFLQVNPKFLFTVDRFRNGEEEEDMMEKLEEISNGLPSLEKIIIVPSKLNSLNKDISNIRNGCFLEEFLLYGLRADGTVPELEFQQLPFNQPILLSYTSGSTGNPKALIHGAGALLMAYNGFYLHENTTRKDVWLSTSPVGWASWNLILSTLLCGVTLVLYEGVPYFLSPTYYWDLIDKYQITRALLTPRIFDAMEKRGFVPNKGHASSLKVICSGGSVVKMPNYDFVKRELKPDVFNVVYVTTELMGFCMICETTLPTHRGELSAPALGVSIQCFDDNGKAVEGEFGEVVITTPMPSFPLYIINDTDGTKLQNTYFKKFPGTFSVGDYCIINPVTKGYIVCGRSDDTLNFKGVRFGCSDIYSIVNRFTEIQDSLCVSQYNDLGDDRVVLFLKMEGGHRFTNNLVQRVRTAIAKELSQTYVPEVILETKGIPHNMNGKKMEIIVKNIINKMPYNPEVVSDKGCLENYKDIPELKDF